MLWAGVNHQDTAEDVASHFLNNSHQNQQGLAAAEPFSSAVICTDQALSWNESNKSLSAHQSSWSHCIHLHSSKLFPASSLFSFLKFGFKLLRGKMLPCCSPVTAGAGERWRAAARAAGPFKHSAWSNLLLPNSPAENRVRYFPWIQNDLPQQFSLLQEKASGRGGREGRGKKKRHYFSELHATFIILPEVPHRDCVEGRKMKTAVEVLGYTAAPCCLWPLPTSAVCSNPGRECPYLLPLAKASLLPLGIIKTVVCLSAKLLRQLQKVIESATRPGLSLKGATHGSCWDGSTDRWGLFEGSNCREGGIQCPP